MTSRDNPAWYTRLRPTTGLLLILVFVCALGIAQLVTFRMSRDTLRGAIKVQERDKITYIGEIINGQIKQKAEYVTSVARLMAGTEALARNLALAPGERGALVEDSLDRLFRQTDLDVLLITNDREVVLYRAHDVAKRGDVATNWGVAEALGGREMVATRRDARGVIISAIEPLASGKRIVGTLEAGLRLNERFIRQLSEFAGVELVLLSRQGDTVASGSDVLAVVDPRAVDEAFLKKIPIYRGDEGDRYTYAYLPVMIIDEAYVVLARLDSAGAFSFLRRLTSEAAINSTLVLVASTLLMIAALWFALRPVRRLRAFADDISIQFTGKRIPSKFKDEAADIEDVLKALTKILIHRHQEIADAMNDGLWDWDVEMGTLSLSSRYCEMLGYETGQIGNTLKSWMEMIHADDRNDVLSALETCLREAGYVETEFRIRSASGSWRHVLGRWRALEIGGRGRTTRVMGTHIDVTEQKRIQEALDESERRYGRIVENMPVGLHIYEFRDGELIVMQSNPASHGILKTEDSAIVGQPLEEAFPPLRDTHYAKRYKELAQHGGAPWTFEYTSSHDDGGLRVALLLTAFQYAPGQVVVFFIDTMQLQKAREELSRSEEKFSTLFRSSPDHIFLMDMRTGVIDDVNRAFLAAAGYSRDEVVGRTVAELGLFKDPAVLGELVDRVRHDGRVANLDAEFVDKRGRSAPHSVSATTVTLGGGTYLLSFCRDVSTVKKMQELMVQTEKMLSVGGIAAGIAHEINNPLGIVLQASQNLERRSRIDSARNKAAAERHGLDLEALGAYFQELNLDAFIANIRNGAERSAAIVRNMLNFSRRSDSDREPFDLAAVVDSAVALASSDYDLKKSYDFKKVQIELDIEDDLPPIMGVRTEIEQVVLNLLRNSAQAMAEAPRQDRPPRIGIRARRRGDKVVLTIEDNGPGIPPELRKRIFEPFFTTKPPGVGTGLGLSVSYYIITNGHRGRISVSSDPGQGTRFTVELPLDPSPPASP